MTTGNLYQIWSKKFCRSKKRFHQYKQPNNFFFRKIPPNKNDTMFHHCFTIVSRNEHHLFLLPPLVRPVTSEPQPQLRVALGRVATAFGAGAGAKCTAGEESLNLEGFFTHGAFRCGFGKGEVFNYWEFLGGEVCQEFPWNLISIRFWVELCVTWSFWKHILMFWYILNI